MRPGYWGETLETLIDYTEIQIQMGREKIEVSEIFDSIDINK